MGFTTIFQILLIVFGIGFLVFIHELGHFVFAKLFKVKVEKFAFGFGPEIIGFTYKETRYTICWIPLGGLVKMPGEDVESATGAPNEFLSQAWYKKFSIAFSGPCMNYLLAIFLFASVIFFWGIEKPTDQPIIGTVISDKPAQKAGIKPQDKILSIQNISVKNWQQMATIIHSNPGSKIKIEIQRNGKKIVLYITPEHDSVSKKGLIGITPSFITEKLGLLDSLYLGLKISIFQTVFTMRYLIEKFIKWETPEVSGPIGVAQILASAAKAGIQQFLHILAIISAALGMFNLLPIPLVDGGHILFSIIEAIIRKPLNKKIIQTANVIGLAFIITIFIFATYSDLSRLGMDFSKYFK